VGAGPKTEKKRTEMSTFILIHGAWHGGWCWYKVIPRLEKKGHTVLAPDLPGHGRDKTPVSTVSLQMYVDRVCQLLEVQRDPVVLVGHSMGGTVVATQAAEHQPHKIRTLVYIASRLLHTGESSLSAAQGDPESLVLPNLVFTPDRSSATVREEALKDVFYGDCSEEDVTLAKMLVVPQAVAPLATPVHTSAENFGRLPRVYIECLRDQTLPAAVQKKQYTALPCQKVISMDTSHSPFFSAPEELAEHLVSL
jgi:pimeloyl-ACP methyl ester carboxylesterase